MHAHMYQRGRDSYMSIVYHNYRRVLFVAFHRTMAVSIVATSCESKICNNILSHDANHSMFSHPPTPHLFPPLMLVHCLTCFYIGVALFMGIYIFCNMMMKWLMALLGVSILTNLGFVLLLEVLVRTHKCKILVHLSITSLIL